MISEKSPKKDVFSPKRRMETPTDRKGDEFLETEKKTEENKESMEIPSKFMSSPNGRIEFLQI